LWIRGFFQPEADPPLAEKTLPTATQMPKTGLLIYPQKSCELHKGRKRKKEAKKEKAKKVAATTTASFYILKKEKIGIYKLDYLIFPNFLLLGLKKTY